MAMSGSLALAVLLSANAPIVAAQNDPNGDRRHVTPSAAAIGFVVAAAVLFLCCCCLQRRRVQRLKTTRLPPLPLTDASFPHGLQYVGTRPNARPTPSFSPQPTTPWSYGGYQTEYPPATAADFAPPPYVKEGGAGPYSPPPGPPPPPIDAAPHTSGPAPAYAPPPGPPPRAHISSNSADFNGGFRPPPVS